MTPHWSAEQFRDWMTRMGFVTERGYDSIAAGRAIGRRERAVQMYATGDRAVDKTTALACMQAERAIS